MENRTSLLNQINWNAVLPLLERQIKPQTQSYDIVIDEQSEELLQYVPRLLYDTMKQTHKQFRLVKQIAKSRLSALPADIVNVEIGKHLFYGSCLDHLEYLKTLDPIDVVVDMGSYSTKVGFQNEIYPTSFHTVVYRPTGGITQEILSEPPKADCYIAEYPRSYRGALSRRTPMERGIRQETFIQSDQQGIVVNWDDFEKILHHAFYNDLKIAPEEHPFHGTYHHLLPKANKEKMTQILFETFNVPAMHLSHPHSVALYTQMWYRNSNHKTAAIVDIGEGTTIVQCIYDAYSVPNSIKKGDYGGKDITEFFSRQFAAEFQLGTTNIDFWRDIKEAAIVTHLPANYETESPFQSSWQNKNLHQDQEKIPKHVQDWLRNCYDEKLGAEKTVTHYNGTTIPLTPLQRMLPVEILFYPQLIGLECVGIHQLIFDSIMACEMDTRKALFSHIRLIGGTANIPGLALRIKHEIEQLVKLNNMVGVEVRVLTSSTIPPEHVTFVGASILCGMKMFQDRWLSKETYDESGPMYMPRKVW